jgi:hypothetical protein
MTSLTALDRCDRCNAQAYVAYDLVVTPATEPFTLLFCAHHNREHGPALLAKGATLVVDETAVLTSPAVSGTTV